MRTWLLYLLWLLTGGKDTAPVDDTDTDLTVPGTEEHCLYDEFEHDDVDYDDAECDSFEFEDSEFEDLEGDEGLFH